MGRQGHFQYKQLMDLLPPQTMYIWWRWLGRNGWQYAVVLRQLLPQRHRSPSSPSLMVENVAGKNCGFLAAVFIGVVSLRLTFLAHIPLDSTHGDTVLPPLPANGVQYPGNPKPQRLRCLWFFITVVRVFLNWPGQQEFPHARGSGDQGHQRHTPATL